jgi:large subunit ribosomal protein L15
MPYIRRLPKRGFNNARFRTEYVPVNLSDLEKNFDDGATVDIEAIKAAGLANGGGRILVKILGNGKLEKKLNVKVHAFSGAAQKAIEGAGGSCEALKVNKSSSERQEPSEQDTTSAE